MFTDKNELIDHLDKGGRVKYLFFWGHTPKTSGAVDKSCLSQWYPCSFEIDSIVYRSAEHFMMAEKARLFKSSEVLERIVAAKSPAEAKKLGRLVKGFDDSKWNAERFGIVVRGNVAKFTQDDSLKKFLLKTGKKVLVEASPRDRIWGIGMGQNNEFAENPRKWRGLNLLGFALMQARLNLSE